MQRNCAAGTGRPLHPDALATGRPCTAWLAAELGACPFRFEPLHIVRTSRGHGCCTDFGRAH
eukprot:7092718-Heterocapsa_arctica.AAC.1